jgi:hypothetical protein
MQQLRGWSQGEFLMTPMIVPPATHEDSLGFPGKPDRRSYGNELWGVAESGLMRKRYASINDAKIQESERRVL